MALPICALRQSGRIDLYAVIAASAAVSYLMLIVRAWHYDSAPFFFLGWNLILAAIPFAISQWLLLFPPRGYVALFAAVFLWLLFFPNAPYLITDLIHLTTRPQVPLWYDLALFLSFAWNGLMLGYLSLLDLQGTMEERFGRRAGWSFAGAALVLASFGIYIGRFLRWNSGTCSRGRDRC